MINNNQLNISYNNSSIKSITSNQNFKLNTKGKFLIDDLTVTATIETPLIDDVNAVNADLREGATAYGNNNVELIGSIPNYNGGVTIVNNISFTIDGTVYKVEEGTTWAEWVNNNSDYFIILYPNQSTQNYCIVDKSKSTITSRDGYWANGTFYCVKTNKTLDYYSNTAIESETITTVIVYGNGPL